MTEIHCSHLTHLNVIRIHGPDALKFLQGQCTQDVMTLTPDGAKPGAFCTAKGRTVTNCWLYARQQDDIFLICHADSAALLANHLKKYIPFFRGTQLSFEPDTYAAIGLYQTGLEFPWVESEDAFTFPWDKTRTILWYRTHSETAKTLNTWLSESEEIPLPNWQANDIKQQIPWLDGEQFERWIPQNFSLDDLGGISFKKGCYTGQEVVARLHYKGQSKKRLFSITWQDDTIVSRQLYQNGKVVGDIINIANTEDGVIALTILKADAAGSGLWLDKEEQAAVELLN